MTTKEKTTFTPGPWFSSPVLVADDGWELCTVGPFDVRGKPDPNHHEDTIAEVSGINHDAEANARLIAAAPELLEALKAVTDMLADQRDFVLGNAYQEEYAAVEKARTAIAKAEGT